MTAALFFLLSILVSQAGTPTKGVDLQLLSEVSTIQPGKTFTVGLHIHHHDAFHTYWQNPGIVGIPTQLDWTLPEGFSAAPIQWPCPEIVDMAGHPAHGFHRDVLLMVDITPPTSIDAKSVTLHANATWMACAKSCHPGNTRFSLTLPVGDATINPAQHDLFARTRKELPRPLQGWTVQLLSKINDSPIRLSLVCQHKPTPSMDGIYFFSTDGQVSSDKPQRLESSGAGRYILTIERAEFGPSHGQSLPGILASSSRLASDGQQFGAINPAFVQIPDKKSALTP